MHHEGVPRRACVVYIQRLLSFRLAGLVGCTQPKQIKLAFPFYPMHGFLYIAARTIFVSHTLMIVSRFLATDLCPGRVSLCGAKGEDRNQRLLSWCLARETPAVLASEKMKRINKWPLIFSLWTSVGLFFFQLHSLQLQHKLLRAYTV